ncbi:hypothetical protein Caci_8992 [Catenulispora acidiphila DSM 44928]|uniref:Uncharacterized protein n=1 Tax=Catenulispora acidiphila (strain DSM 44928 / JCM 14897 / NBRC 102108 / NRRL B-24433 / ID139908) TaxID=479433 RepID=C7Q5J4_CATAD|nr:hypothetical protein [Catenulispora acidiphila]ACU77805.1 hypothetical protein Caci_8992 [Catenulispora acidiphila DSM 44928]
MNTDEAFGHAFTAGHDGNHCTCGEHRFAAIHNPERYPFTPELHDSAEDYADVRRHWASPWQLRAELTSEAEQLRWRTIALMTAPDGEPVEDYDWHAQHGGANEPHICHRALWQSNSETIERVLCDAGANFSVWRGIFTYDASHGPTLEAVAALETSLAHYPSLDDARLCQLEQDAACAELLRGWKVPEDLVQAVLTGLGERGCSLCPECESWPVDDILAEHGVVDCAAECGGQVRSRESAPLCHDCAEAEAGPGCDCVTVMVNSKRPSGAAPTRADIFIVRVNCNICYTYVLPHAGIRA